METDQAKSRLSTAIAIVLLAFFVVLSVASIWNDSATMDESVHIPAAYSYLSQKDMRLNPEHPPLLKDLSAVPLLLMKINFPAEHPSWAENINDQWAFGPKFLYESGNDADEIIFWARIFPILLAAFLGYFLFVWAGKNFGRKTALLTLALFVFSPTVLAHGRLVTTDVAAAAGIALATACFLNSFKNPNLKNTIIAGLLFGMAMLMKFSTFLLMPYFFGLAIVWAFLKKTGYYKSLLQLSLIFLIGFVVIVWPVYQYNVWNYPPERQARDSAEMLKTFGAPPAGGTEKTCLEGQIKKCPVELTVWIADKPILRPFAQYLLGFLMVLQRSTGGNTTFFLGEVSNQAWPMYFPIIYAIKEPLAFHILTIIAILFAAWKIKEPFWRAPYHRLKTWIQNHFVEFALLGFIAFYWFMSVRANLNIGVRHLMPVLPLTYILVGSQISKWLNNAKRFNFRTLTVGALFIWYIFGTLWNFPHFLSYFNELAGGPYGGWRYATDSNLDWGQDLKRLADFVEEKQIPSIAVDYFGGGSPRYYLGDKYEPWWSAKGKPRGWFAISATFRQSAWGEPIKNLATKPEDNYSWLRPHEPVATIGHSIFVYYLP